ncbi:hypothetical protein HPB47_021363 [Ixodes persulcatus]|uniref:Uncharacterized protein n=1 Tax=Ixodes persulcatus TaxID=34615 RepID=A0AC60QCT0_IXOPE|nr:hypothetical protein HPB47_021363 [Ixodes persulcatus]
MWQRTCAVEPHKPAFAGGTLNWSSISDASTCGSLNFRVAPQHGRAAGENKPPPPNNAHQMSCSRVGSGAEASPHRVARCRQPSRLRRGSGDCT